MGHWDLILLIPFSTRSRTPLNPLNQAFDLRRCPVKLHSIVKVHRFLVPHNLDGQPKAHMILLIFVHDQRRQIHSHRN